VKSTSRFRWARVIHGLLSAGLLISTLLPGGLGCSQTRPCRAGTLWLSIQLKGPSAAVNALSISVSVNGAAPKTSMLSFPTGQTSGAVEVQFPGGYPASNPAVVSVTAYSDAVPLAEKSMALTLMPSCSVLEMELDFSVDAGGGDHDMQATGGTSATGGRAAGGATAGAAGTAGGSGAAGGTAGSFSATGGRGTGGTPLDAGTDRPCTIRGPENCYDGIDNDCNGKTDCEDEVCSPIAQCESLDPALGTVGTSIQSSATCPQEAPTPQLLHSGLASAGCSGCSCAIGTATVTCTTNLYGYATAAECADATALGQLAGTLASTQPCQTPAWPASFVFGVRADAFQAVLGGVCAPTGTPTKGIPVWATTTKFCTTPRVGAGCGDGRACVPRTVVASGACLLMDGTQTCPANLKQTRWSIGYLDGRTCNACSCGSPEGDCQPKTIVVGNDYSCADAAVHGSLASDQLRLCVSGTTGAYSPGLQFSGPLVAPTCRPTLANISGALTPTGAQTLCCL
jgi:hypothetical protein